MVSMQTGMRADPMVRTVFSAWQLKSAPIVCSRNLHHKSWVLWYTGQRKQKNVGWGGCLLARLQVVRIVFFSCSHVGEEHKLTSYQILTSDIFLHISKIFAFGKREFASACQKDSLSFSIKIWQIQRIFANVTLKFAINCSSWLKVILSVKTRMKKRKYDKQCFVRSPIVELAECSVKLGKFKTLACSAF